MNVLMLGWEFPPYNSGGLGVACEGLAKSFIKNGMNVTFVMPKAPKDAKCDFLKLMNASNYSSEDEISNSEKIRIKKVNSLIKPYMTSEEYDENIEKIKNSKNVNRFMSEEENFDSLDDQYGKDLFEEVYRYAIRVGIIAKNEDFDVIHGHDWMTFQAGVRAKEASGKPFVIHIHNTAFDRSGGNPNPAEYQIEKEGFEKADKIIAISELVKNRLVNSYFIDKKKIEVVHNGIDTDNYSYLKLNNNFSRNYKTKKRDKMVLFAGRVTLQKGPDYFIKAAKKVCEKEDNVKFVVAGNGDKMYDSIEMAAEMGIASKCVFTGRYKKEQGQQLMNMADVFVMPSVSEPFGLVPLEAIMQKTPTIISKQSGVSEILKNTLKVDFWDINQLANTIISSLRYPSLGNQLSEYGEEEVKNLTWDVAASRCNNIFHSFKMK
ncbi:MAG: glycosyltransferase family 4 protein [Nanobdellota archaeon]